VEALRFLVGRARQLAQQVTVASTAAQAQEAERLAEHIRRGEAREFACAAEAASRIPGAIMPSAIV
jgi:hypothetical protein